MKQSIHGFRVPDKVAGLIRNMHPHLKKKVQASLQLILSNPYSGKVLKDELAGLKSFRVSRFRIIYRISSDRIIEVVAIGPRESIYEETLRILSKKKNESKG
jgi:mRNA interferase RelE/StbE